MYLQSGINLTSWTDADVLMSHIVGTLGAISVLMMSELVYTDKESVVGEKICRSSRSWEERKQEQFTNHCLIAHLIQSNAKDFMETKSAQKKVHSQKWSMKIYEAPLTQKLLSVDQCSEFAWPTWTWTKSVVNFYANSLCKTTNHINSYRNDWISPTKFHWATVNDNTKC